MQRIFVISLAIASLFAASGLVVTRAPASDSPPRSGCTVVVVALDPGYSVSRTREQTLCN